MSPDAETENFFSKAMKAMQSVMLFDVINI
jgi:hypothetical protein